MTAVSRSRVAPFRNLRIKGCLHLPEAYRSLPRLSSPLDTKASPMRPWSLDQKLLIATISDIFYGSDVRFHQEPGAPWPNWSIGNTHGNVKEQTHACGDDRTRTCAHLLAKQALYQLSYIPRTKPSGNRLVGLSRVELLTPALSERCSNQLSYKPVTINDRKKVFIREVPA
jgi:hypothetical protein